MPDRDVALNIDVDFHIVNCGECGGQYALNSRYVEQKHNEGGFWRCPYCECSWGYGTSKMDALKKQHEKERRELRNRLEREETRRRWAEQAREQARAEADHQAARAAGYKGALTKTKKRVGRGVCPCCNRSFDDLRRHMESKHPEYADDDPMPVGLHFHCGAETAIGEPCRREVSIEGATCWQHS